MERVFVYGSLKKGCWAHHILEDSEFVGEAQIPGLLFAGSSFPMAFPLPEGYDGSIKGEVYKVDEDTLKRLDCFEGHPHMYERTSITLASDNEAYIYYYKGSTEALKLLPEGVWNG